MSSTAKCKFLLILLPLLPLTFFVKFHQNLSVKIPFQSVWKSLEPKLSSILDPIKSTALPENRRFEPVKLKVKHLKKVQQQRKPVNPRGSKSILLAVGVLSKLSATGRRESIRLTWFRICQKNPDIVQCRFITDSYAHLSNTEKQKYSNEKKTYKDILHTPRKEGHNFALNLIWMMRWYMKRYDFDYFLRIDDDYFLCLERLLLELPHRPKHGLYWGWIHCEPRVLRVDEGWMILSHDLIEEALSKWNTTLVCHPFGDQAVAIWMQASKKNVTYFLDNERLAHQATSYNYQKFLKPDMCQKYLGFHGTYSTTMLRYWIVYREHQAEKNTSLFRVPPIKPLKSVCAHDKAFDWNGFGDSHRFEPKLCKDNPTWSITNHSFQGREDTSKDL